MLFSQRAGFPRDFGDIRAGIHREISVLVGYQLVFWQEASSLEPAPTYRALSDGSPVDGLRSLPIDEILARLGEVFPDGVREASGPSTEWFTWESTDQRLSYQVVWSDQHVLAELRPLSAEVANRIIDVLTEFDCPLFDPQTGERFHPPVGG